VRRPDWIGVPLGSTPSSTFGPSPSSASCTGLGLRGSGRHFCSAAWLGFCTVSRHALRRHGPLGMDTSKRVIRRDAAKKKRFEGEAVEPKRVSGTSPERHKPHAAGNPTEALAGLSPHPCRAACWPGGDVRKLRQGSDHGAYSDHLHMS
jgi:hypothetical protein